MAFALSTPTVDDLNNVVDALRDWQSDAAPFQLHPGDLGWAWRFGDEAMAVGLRTWRRDGRMLAVGMLDGPTLLRLTVAPDAHGDEGLAHRIVDDVIDPARGVLPEGRVSVEAPRGALVHDVLSDAGWKTDEPWTPLQRDLMASVQDPQLRIEVVGPALADEWAAVVRASFDGSTFSAERWHAMAAAPPYADARSLLARDEDGAAVAAITVWSAGAGRPGLIEPMGVHREHRGRGYGRAITLAAAASLRELGSSSAMVCTPSTNVAGVATYASAGFQRLPERQDRYRDA